MKKIIAWALALTLLCLSVPALAEDLTGDWYLLGMKTEEISINAADQGVSTVMTLNADGTAQVVSAYGEGEPDVLDGAWTVTDVGVAVTMEESTQEFVLEDGTLVLEEEGMVSVFGREAPAPTAMPAFIAAETEDQFFGEWVLTKSFYMGMTMSASAMGDSRVIIEAGKLTESTAAEDGDEPISIEHATAFADGKLTVNGEEGEALLTVELMEDGGLAVAVGEGELLILMFFERPAA